MKNKNSFIQRIKRLRLAGYEKLSVVGAVYEHGTNMIQALTEGQFDKFLIELVQLGIQNYVILAPAYERTREPEE